MIRRYIDRLLTANLDVTGALGRLRFVLVLLALNLLFNWYSLFNHVTWKITTDDYKGSTFIAKKIESPFTPLDTTADPYLHFEKIAFRFVPFALAHLLHIDQQGLYRLQVALGFLFPLLIWQALFAATRSMPIATACALLINGLYCGFAFFYDDS